MLLIILILVAMMEPIATRLLPCSVMLNLTLGKQTVPVVNPASSPH
jgi:hypothetical protein